MWSIYQLVTVHCFQGILPYSGLILVSDDNRMSIPLLLTTATCTSGGSSWFHFNMVFIFVPANLTIPLSVQKLSDCCEKCVIYLWVCSASCIAFDFLKHFISYIVSYNKFFLKHRSFKKYLLFQSLCGNNKATAITTERLRWQGIDASGQLPVSTWVLLTATLPLLSADPETVGEFRHWWV